MIRSENIKTIYKYLLEVTDYQIIDLPAGAEILSVQPQPPPYGNIQEQLCMWVQIDTQNELEPRRIRIFGTGNSMSYEHQLRFIGTVQMNNHAFVWHVFENILEL